jgi:hypothetical protein
MVAWGRFMVKQQTCPGGLDSQFLISAQASGLSQTIMGQWFAICQGDETNRTNVQFTLRAVNQHTLASIAR